MAVPPSVSDTELFPLLAKAADGAAHREQKSAKSDGLFPVGVKGKALAAAARDRGFTEACPDPNARTPKGRAPKLTHVRLTAAGREQLFRHLSPKAALEALHRLLEQRRPAPAEGDGAGSLAAQVADLRAAVDRLQAELAAAAARRRDEAAEWQRLLGVLEGKVAEAVGQAQALAAPGPATAPPPRDVRKLEDETVRFVGEWARDRGYGCQVDELKAHLDGIDPGLTVGGFHDLLRGLHEAGRIRLSGWGQTLDEIPRPNLALFVSHKVMYYVHPGDRAP